MSHSDSMNSESYADEYEAQPEEESHMDDDSDEQFYTPPEWIERRKDGFICRHPELDGLFTFKPYNFRIELQFEQIKSQEMGGQYTPDLESMAELSAAISVGFEDVPQEFPRLKVKGVPAAERHKLPVDPGQLTSLKLVQALGMEVLEHWRLLRAE